MPRVLQIFYKACGSSLAGAFSSGSLGVTGLTPPHPKFLAVAPKIQETLLIFLRYLVLGSHLGGLAKQVVDGALIRNEATID